MTSTAPAPSRANPFVGSGGGPSGVAVAAAAGGAFLAKLLLALSTYGTNDVYDWEMFATWERALGVGMLRPLPQFNHPPSIIHFNRLFWWLSEASGLPWPFWFRLPSIVADLGSVLLVWTILASRRREPSIAWALLLYAASPLLVMTTGFHGNTDGLMLFFVLLSVLGTERGRGAAAGAAFGLATSVKVLPLVLLPVLLLSLGGFRQRARFLASAAAVVLVAWSPFLFQDPGAVFLRVFRYRSFYGDWGVPFLASRIALLGRPFAWLDEGLRGHGAFLAMGSVLALSLWMNRSEWLPAAPGRPRAFAQVGLVLVLFLVLTNGFGVQYLAWLAPWVVGMGALPTAVLCATSGVFAFLAYDTWSQGLPWYLADAYRISMHGAWNDLSMLLCWLSVAGLLCLAWPRSQPRSGARGSKVRTAVLLVGALLVLLPLLVRFSFPPSYDRARSGEDAVNTKRAWRFRELAKHLLDMGRDDDALAAADEAIRIDSRSSDSRAVAAFVCARLGRWDEAVHESKEALRLSPGSPDARKNLAWILEQRRLAESGPGP